jgi:hypothetical protein
LVAGGNTYLRRGNSDAGKTFYYFSASRSIKYLQYALRYGTLIPHFTTPKGRYDDKIEENCDPECCKDDGFVIISKIQNTCGTCRIIALKRDKRYLKAYKEGAERGQFPGSKQAMNLVCKHELSRKLVEGNLGRTAH